MKPKTETPAAAPEETLTAYYFRREPVGWSLYEAEIPKSEYKKTAVKVAEADYLQSTLITFLNRFKKKIQQP